MTADYHHEDFLLRFQKALVPLGIVFVGSSILTTTLGLWLYDQIGLRVSSTVYAGLFLLGSSLLAVVCALAIACLGSRSGKTLAVASATVASMLFAGYYLPIWGRLFDWTLRHQSGPMNYKSLGVCFLFLSVAVVLGGAVAALGLAPHVHRMATRTTLLVALASLGLSLVHPAQQQVTTPGPSLPVGTGERQAQQSPNTIVILSFDALRADHLSAYGYERETSPELDRYLTDGLLFERAIAPKTKTGPSLASLATGLYPVRHGAVRHGWGLADSVPALPALVEGYETAAFIANPIIKRHLKESGFELAKFYRGEPAETVLSDAKAWVRRQGDKPSLLWVHLFEPHTPYIPEQSDLEHFAADAFYEVEIPYDLAAAAQKFAPELGRAPSDEAIRDRVNLEATKYDAYIRSSTRTAAAFLDDVVDMRGEDVLFIITSDHGESMVEHDFFFWHGKYCYQPVVQVPLAIYWPSAELRGRSELTASLVDIMPTLCAVTGCKEGSQFDGINLIEHSAKPPGVRAVFTSGLDNPNYSRWSIVRGAKKLIASPDRSFTFLDGLLENRDRLLARWFDRSSPTNPYRFRRLHYELFDLDQDPGELHNLSDRNDTLRVALSNELLLWYDLQLTLAESRGVTHDQEISDETLEELKALGYLN